MRVKKQQSPSSPSMTPCLAFGLALGLVSAVACKSPAGARLLDDDQVAGSGGGGATATYDGPPGGLAPAENAALFAKYCSAGADVGDPVNPNYADPDVARAARILATIKPDSFKLYFDMLKMHMTPVPTDVPGLNKSAHEFLTYLCGEFRDRASMIRAKLDWVFNIRYLATSGGEAGKSCASRNDPLQGNVDAGSLPPVEEFDRSKSPWAQMCVEDYQPYLAISRSLFDFRQYIIRQGQSELEGVDGAVVTGALTLGEREGIDRHVPGFSACETKYIFAEYVKKGVTFARADQTPEQAYQAYMAGYGAFKAGCTEEDLGWYYDFRGDSNYKPNSPEGNGMIWMGKVAAAQCETRVKAREGMAMTDADCRRYYENPFRSRYLAARAGLAAWLLHDRSLESLFASRSGSYYTIVNHAHDNPSDVFGSNGPYLFRVDDQFSNGKLQTPGTPGRYLPGFQAHWGDKDFGLVQLSGLTGDAAKQFLFERLQRSVDRHTNWYMSGYDSAPSLPLTNKARRTIDQAYSPFVASSYEMSASNLFSQCGITIPCGNAGPDFTEHKQWMFIFKVRKENWFRPEDIAAGNLSPDFDRIWFDETAFGDDGLANSERAWDRLGTPLEEELAEILYLWRIPAE